MAERSCKPLCVWGGRRIVAELKRFRESRRLKGHSHWKNKTILAKQQSCKRFVTFSSPELKLICFAEINIYVGLYTVALYQRCLSQRRRSNNIGYCVCVCVRVSCRSCDVHLSSFCLSNSVCRLMLVPGFLYTACQVSDSNPTQSSSSYKTHALPAINQNVHYRVYISP